MDLPDTLLRQVCEHLATDRDVMEEFVEAFGFPRDSLKDFLLRKRIGYIFFRILKKHSVTPVQLLRDVCASLCDDDVVVELLDNTLRSYKPGPPLHLVRPLEEIRDIHKERIQRKPITYLQRGAILIIDHAQFSTGNEFKSFFMDLDPTNEVTTLCLQARGLELGLRKTLESWQRNQGQ